MLGEGETISGFVVDAVRRAVDFRRIQREFYARGEAAWQEYLRTGISHPLSDVAEHAQARLAARRRELQNRNR